MTATRGRTVFLRQIQRGFTSVGFLFVFGGVVGFLLLFITHAQVDRLVPLAFLTAFLEGIGMFAIAIALEIVISVTTRWQGKKGGRL
jgi:hypothetical protein